MFSALRVQAWKDPRARSRGLALALICVITGCGRIHYDHVGALDAGADLDDSGPADDADSGGADADAGNAPSDAGDDGDATAAIDGASSLDGEAGEGGPDGDAGNSPRDAGFLTGVIDVTDRSQMVLLASATVAGETLVLTPDVPGVVGGAYLRTPYPVTSSASFSVSFSFHITGAAARRGDGLALVWQNDPRRTESLGSPGGGMGYNGITPSVAVELDPLANTYDARGNQVAVATNGNHMIAIAEAPAPVTLDDGATHYVWIEYDGVANTLSAFLADTAQRPPSATLTASVDLHALLGTSAFLGFTAACGGASELSVIESLSIEYRP